jgi:hypothetical protein
MNITGLLKSNFLEEDGIEDMHFYLVAISNHKQGLLVKQEQKAYIESVKRELYDKGEIDTKEDLKVKLKIKDPKQISGRVTDKEAVKTIESVEEI